MLLTRLLISSNLKSIYYKLYNDLITAKGCINRSSLLLYLFGMEFKDKVFLLALNI